MKPISIYTNENDDEQIMKGINKFVYSNEPVFTQNFMIYKRMGYVKDMYIECKKTLDTFLWLKTVSNTHLHLENWESIETIPAPALLEIYNSRPLSTKYMSDSNRWIAVNTYQCKLLCEISKRIGKAVRAFEEPDDCILY